MKKIIVATLGVLVVVGAALAIIPTTRDEIHWLWASHKDGTTSYESYVKAWPEGRHAVESRALYDERGWAEAETANTVQGFERYIQLHGEGKHIAEAKNNIDSLHWQEATTANTIKSYLGYTANHPQGKFTQQAKTKASALRIDEASYDATLRACSEASLKQFLADFPGHKKEAEVQQALSDWQKATELNTGEGYKVFLSKHNKSILGHCLTLLVEDRIQGLMKSANCRRKKEFYHITKELLSKEIREKLENLYGNCIRADNFCEYCGKPAVGWCHMRSKYVCDTHRYFTQGGTRWRCPP